VRLKRKKGCKKLLVGANFFLRLKFRTSAQCDHRWSAKKYPKKCQNDGESFRVAGQIIEKLHMLSLENGPLIYGCILKFKIKGSKVVLEGSGSGKVLKLARQKAFKFVIRNLECLHFGYI